MASASGAAGAEAGAGSSRTRACQTGSALRGRCHSDSGKTADIAERIFMKSSLSETSLKLT